MILSNPVNINIFRKKTSETFIFRNVELRKVIVSLYNWSMQGYISYKDAEDIIKILGQLAKDTSNIEAIKEINIGLSEVYKIIKSQEE